MPKVQSLQQRQGGQDSGSDHFDVVVGQVQVYERVGKVVQKVHRVQLVMREVQKLEVRRGGVEAWKEKGIVVRICILVQVVDKSAESSHFVFCGSPLMKDISLLDKSTALMLGGR